MLHQYFLGGASPEGFVSDFLTEQKSQYGYLLKGGPGTGKSTLLRTVAGAFADESVSLYHCASDPHSLDAVVLEDRGVYLADATAPHEMSVSLPFVNGELVDLGRALHPQQLMGDRDAIELLSLRNTALHDRVKTMLSAISSLKSISLSIGDSALQKEKLTAFAGRLAKRLVPHGRGAKHSVAVKPLYRQCSALTPAGMMTFLPEGYRCVLIQDEYGAAAIRLLGVLSETIAAGGMQCVLTRCLTLKGKPVVHCMIPECELNILTASQLEQAPTDPLMQINLQRFYDPASLRQQRMIHRFSMKSAASLLTQTTALLSEALQVHDDLERYFIASQNRTLLQETTDAVCTSIRKYHPKQSKS